MDSGNSGSLQSSSGGDEEYDSRAAATVDPSIFMNTQPPPQPPSLFDPFSNYTHQLHHQNPNNFNNIPNQAWPGSTSIRPDPSPSPFMSSFQPPPQAAAPAPVADTTATTAARNPRKRSRASRRAPTTVLTTDTTNFRAMVQEFTGIPAPPFSNPSFPRPNRLDNLFGSRPGSLDRRPFTQRGQTTSFLVPSSTNNYPFSHTQTSINLLNNINNNNNQNQNPLLLSSLLQTKPSKFIFSGSSDVMGSKPHNPGPLEKIGPSPDEFGLGRAHVTTTLNDRDQERDSENAAKWRRNNNEFSGSTSNFEGEKGPGPENVATARAGEQGMVESWIYSSE